MERAVARGGGGLIFAPTARAGLLGGGWVGLPGAALLVMFLKGSWVALLALVLVVVITAPGWWRLATAGALVVGAVVATQIPLGMARLATLPPSINGRQAAFAPPPNLIPPHPSPPSVPPGFPA